MRVASADSASELLEDGELSSLEELRSIAADGSNALVQMLGTVNEVLDFRAIDANMRSISLNKHLVPVEKVRTCWH